MPKERITSSHKHFESPSPCPESASITQLSALVDIEDRIVKKSKVMTRFGTVTNFGDVLTIQRDGGENLSVVANRQTEYGQDSYFLSKQAFPDDSFGAASDYVLIATKRRERNSSTVIYIFNRHGDSTITRSYGKDSSDRSRQLTMSASDAEDAKIALLSILGNMETILPPNF